MTLVERMQRNERAALPLLFKACGAQVEHLAELLGVQLTAEVTQQIADCLWDASTLYVLDVPDAKWALARVAAFVVDLGYDEETSDHRPGIMATLAARYALGLSDAQEEVAYMALRAEPAAAALADRVASAVAAAAAKSGPSRFAVK